MTITIRALVADPSLNLTIRVGQGCLDQPIGWVAVSELPDPTPWLEGAKLLLTSGMWLRGAQHPETADQWAARLSETGIKAVGFGLQPCFTTMPPEILQAARRHRLTLLEVPPQTPFVAVARWVADRNASEARRHETEALRGQQRLVGAAQSGRRAVVSTLARELRGWVVVLDASHEPTVQAGALEAVDLAGVSEIAETATRNGKHSLLAELQGQPVYLVPLGPVDNRLGTLCVDMRTATASPARRSALVGTAAAILSVLLPTVDASVQQVIVELLLDGDDDSARRVCSASGISLPDPLVAVGLSGPGKYEALERAKALGAWHVPLKVTSAVVLLAEPSMSEARLLPLVEQTKSRAGISALHSCGDVPRAIQEAMSALALARNSRHSMVNYRETTSSGLQGVLSSDTTLQFAATLLSPLEEHPDRELLLTSAAAWVKSHGKWDPAAAALGVHRETLRGRMKRLETTLGLDLDAPQDRLALSLLVEALPWRE